MAFNFRSPLSSVQLTDTQSVSREKTFGTSFGSSMIGGYHEVYSLSDLDYVIPTGVTGSIEYTGNTIPVKYSVKTLPFLPNTLTVNSDGISSGRRRLGMLVYVVSEATTFQYQIPNYSTLWDNADDGSTIVSDTYGYTVKDNTSAGQALIGAWTGSTIEGVSGATRTNANWVKYHANAPEFIAINSVPYNTTLDSWVTNNSFNDAFIAVPYSLMGRYITRITASYGAANSLSGMTYTMNIKDATGTTESSRQWTHPSGQNSYTLTFTTPVQLPSGGLIEIINNTTPDTQSKGYTVILEVTG